MSDHGGDSSDFDDAFAEWASYVAAYDTQTGRQEHLLFAESFEQAHSLAREQAPAGWMLVDVRPNMDLD